MKKKTKYLFVILPIIIMFVIVGSYNIVIKSNQKKFTTTLNQCKTIIEDKDTILSPAQIVFIENFENKYYKNGKYDNEFSTQFIPYLETKMKERIKFDDVDDVNKLVVVSRLVALNTKGKIEDLRVKLMNRKNELEALTASKETINTSTAIDGTSVFKPNKATSTNTQPSEPSVGMTKDEVITSTWGKPVSKNITTTANGTTEQWVYYNNEYIYFEEGIVTAISSH